MKRLILILPLFCFFSVLAYAQQTEVQGPIRKKAVVNIRPPAMWPTFFQSNPPLTIQEADGSPKQTNASKLIFNCSGCLSRSGTTITFTPSSASGDVAGPASSTDNAIVRFDGTTGKLIQNSVVTIADSTGNMAGVGTLNTHTIPGGTDTFAMLGTQQTFTASQINSKNGALSLPAASWTGTPVTGGTATTTKPLVLIETAGATSANWATTGSMMGINAPSGFTGDLINAQVNGGTTQFQVSALGIVVAPRIRVPNGGIDIQTNGVGLGNTQQFTWSSNSDGSARVSGIASTANAAMRATNGSTGVGSFGFARAVTAKTSNYTVLNTDTGTTFTNTGAAGTVNFTLPTAAAGLWYTFYRDADFTVQATAAASTTIRVAGSVSASAGNVTLDAVGSSVTLIAISTTQWIAFSSTGTLTVTELFNHDEIFNDPLSDPLLWVRRRAA